MAKPDNKRLYANTNAKLQPELLTKYGELNLYPTKDF